MALPAGADPPVRGALATALISLAGLPDHAPTVDGRLGIIARLAVERIAVVRYASITALRGENFTTVAVSDDLIRAIDDVQYADGDGPCLEALNRGVPVGVPDIDSTVLWPGFHEAAPRMGLHASASVPLFAGRGDPIAALNMYSPDRTGMKPLIDAIYAVHGDPGERAFDEERLTGLDRGGQELVLGYAEALNIRATIRLALELIRADNRCGPDDAYLSLCIRAADAGTDLADAALAVISRDI